MGNFRVALFDLDGTLFDTEGQYTIFWQKIGEQFCPTIPHFAQQIKGTTLKQIFERYFPTPDLQSQISPLLEQWEATMDYHFFSGALDFIRNLRQNGVKCAVVTSSDTKKMTNVYRALPEFKNYFDKVFTAEDFAESKPSPDCYLRAAAAFGVALSECVVFEDAYAGLQAGMSSGIFTVGVPSGHTPEELATRCHYVIDNFTSLTYERICQIKESSNK